MDEMLLGGDPLHTEYSVRPGAPFRLNLPMITDSLEDRGWEYTSHRHDELPAFAGCRIYHGQRPLQEDTLYIVPEGMEADFPADRFSYITTTALRGQAPHIRCVRCSFVELVNGTMAVFARYADLERELYGIISSGGSLSELCCAAGRFFRNPVYVHDNMFCVIGQSTGVEGLFEFSDITNKPHIPLWLINEYKFDKEYKKTYVRRQAGVWENEESGDDGRSLYVNLWEEEEYLGRLIVHETESAIRPGQFRAAEYFAGYVLLWLKNQTLSARQRSYSYEQTFIDLITQGQTDERNLKTVLGILNWKQEDRYLCLKLQSQNVEDIIHSDLALNSRLSTVLGGHVSFRYQQKICTIVNLSMSGIDLGELRQRLAPLVRDSCLYVGISNPVRGIHAIRRGFLQADFALDYITGTDSSDWMVLFSACALSYIQTCACEKLPGEMVAHPVLLELREYDRLQGSRYYETLRVYLQCERSIPATAAALIIHRTTLTYRLGKIMELTRLNLDNPDLRLYLLLSFQLLDRERE